MSFLNKIPGPFLVFLGACTLSFGGLIVKSFEGANLWQILFWRSFFFSIVVLIFIIINHKKKFLNSIYKIGLPGLFGGVVLCCGYASYVFAMYNTTVANANFIIQTQTIFLAIFGYVFLKEKISKLTLFSIFLAFIGIFLMLGNSLTAGQMIGNIVAFVMPVSFAVLILIVRKYPKVDMIPAQFVAGVFAALIGWIIAGNISVTSHDLFLGFLAGTFQIGFGFIMITIGSQTTPAAVVGILMLTEAVFGPVWAWFFINEIPPISVIIGGSIIISAILFEFFLSPKIKE